MILETILFIFVIIEAWQLRQLILTNRNTNSLIKDLTTNPKIAGAILLNGIYGLSRGLKTNKAYQEEVSTLVKSMGEIIIDNFEIDGPGLVRQTIAKIRDNPDLQKEVFQFVAACAQVASQHVTQDVKEKVKQTIETEIPIPKEYRWIAEAAKALNSGSQVLQGPKAAQAAAKPAKNGGLLPLD